VLFQKSTSSRQWCTLSLDKAPNKKSIWELLKTFSRWSVPPQVSAIPFQVDNAWPLVSSYSNNLKMCSYILSQSDLTLLMMTISIGTLVLRQLLPEITRMLKRHFCKSKMRSIRTSTLIYHGCADAILWTRSLT